MRRTPRLLDSHRKSPGNPGNSRSVLLVEPSLPPPAGVFKEKILSFISLNTYPRRWGEGGLSSESTDGLCPGFYWCFWRFIGGHRKSTGNPSNQARCAAHTHSPLSPCRQPPSNQARCAAQRTVCRRCVFFSL